MGLVPVVSIGSSCTVTTIAVAVTSIVSLIIVLVSASAVGTIMMGMVLPYKRASYSKEASGFCKLPISLIKIYFSIFAKEEYARALAHIVIPVLL